MSFKPSIHGWPFSISTPVEPHRLGLDPSSTAGAGLGGGLCWAALDRYLRGLRISRAMEAPGPGDPLYVELLRRQVAALSGVRERMVEWHDRPYGSWRDRIPLRVPGGRDVASLSRAEWAGARKRLNAGEPVLLTLLMEGDPYERGRALRQVLAVDWRRAGRRVTVSIYDPDRPSVDHAHLGFDRAGALSARLDDGGAVRGFFAVPYDRATPRGVRPESFEDRSVIGLNRTVAGHLAPVVSRKRIELVARNGDVRRPRSAEELEAAVDALVQYLAHIEVL